MLPSLNTPGLKDKISEALQGCLEVPLFMTRGVFRFADDDDFVRLSFLIPALLIPVAAAIGALYTPAFEGVPFIFILLSAFVRMVLSIAFAYVFVFAVYKKLGRLDGFPRFVVAANWLNLSAFIMQLPPIIMAASGRHAWEDLQSLILFFLLYIYAYGGFLVSRTGRLGVAASVAMVGAFIAIDEAVAWLAAPLTQIATVGAGP